MTFVTVLVFGTVIYTASKVEGWGLTSQAQSLANASCNKSASKTSSTPADVTINVYNSTPRAGFAASVAKKVQDIGFNVAAVDNDPLGRTISGVGEIRHGDNGLAGSALLSTVLPGATVVQDSRANASVDLVLGNKFRALSAPTQRELVNAVRSLKNLRAHC